MRLAISTSLVLLLMCGVWCQRMAGLGKGSKASSLHRAKSVNRLPHSACAPQASASAQRGIHVDRSYVTRDGRWVRRYHLTLATPINGIIPQFEVVALGGHPSFFSLFFLIVA